MSDLLDDRLAEGELPDSYFDPAEHALSCECFYCLLDDGWIEINADGEVVFEGYSSWY